MNLLHPISPVRRVGHRRGQTLIFLLMVTVILSFVMFSVYDTQHVIVQRVRSQNGVDAAALTGARWQLSSLNAIGEINLLKVTTMIVTQPPPGLGYPAPVPQELWGDLYGALDTLQDRIRWTGPLMGVLYAQQAAKLNGMHALDAFAEPFRFWARFLEEHAALYEPLMGQDSLANYRTLLQQIADTGVAALPGNAYGDSGSLDYSNASSYARYLADRGFYGAIAGRDWCWFHWHRPLLWVYTDWTFWGPVTVSTPPDPFQYLQLHLARENNYHDDTWGSLSGSGRDTLEAAISQGLDDRGLELSPNWPQFTTTNWPQFYDTNLPSYVELNWYVFRSDKWDARWDPESVAWLLTSDVKPQFNYTGADSVWIVQASANVVMSPSTVYDQQAHQWREQPENIDKVSWTERGQQGGLREAFQDLASLKANASYAGRGIVASAAAKAFGSIDGSTRPNDCRVVLPLFKDVRLIPIAFSSVGSDFDPMWLEHLFDHVPDYTTKGLSALSSWCYYCQQLRTWENEAFRREGQDWLDANSSQCRRGGGGGGGHGGIIAH